jgi:flagellar biogenesis protein FliO
MEEDEDKRGRENPTDIVKGGSQDMATLPLPGGAETHSKVPSQGAADSIIRLLPREGSPPEAQNLNDSPRATRSSSLPRFSGPQELGWLENKETQDKDRFPIIPRKKNYRGSHAQRADQLGFLMAILAGFVLIGIWFLVRFERGKEKNLEPAATDVEQVAAIEARQKAPRPGVNAKMEITINQQRKRMDEMLEQARMENRTEEPPQTEPDAEATSTNGAISTELLDPPAENFNAPNWTPDSLKERATP